MKPQKTVVGLFLMLVLAIFSTKAQGSDVTLNIVMNGTGMGKVTSIPPGIVDCSSSCSVQIPTETKLKLNTEFAGVALLGLLHRRWRGLTLGLLLSGVLVSCPPPNQDLRSYQISLTDATSSASSQTIAVTGLPLTGATIAVAK